MPETPSKSKPVIKWSGSKRSSAQEIVNSFPLKIKSYYEPFCGGCSVLYEILKRNIDIERIVCSDKNNDLISLWLLIKSNPEHLISRYRDMWQDLNVDVISNVRNQYYYKIRNRFNAHRDSCDFFFLLRTATNGLVRFNKKNQFNTSFHFSRPGIDPDTISAIIRDWSKVLNDNNVEFVCQEYNCIDPVVGDFIYLDPPYSRTVGIYHGGLKLNIFFDWLRSLPCNYALSFDGKSGENDMTYDMPTDLYNNHIYIKSGVSSFKRIRTDNKTDMVYESLYLKTI